MSTLAATGVISLIMYSKKEDQNVLQKAIGWSENSFMSSSWIRTIDKTMLSWLSSWRRWKEMNLRNARQYSMKFVESITQKPLGYPWKKKCSQKVLEQRSKLSEQEVLSNFLSSLIDDKICVHFFDDCKKSNWADCWNG